MGSTEQQMCPFCKREEREDKETRGGLLSRFNLGQTLFESQQMVFSSGALVAACRLRLAFRAPLGVISPLTDPRRQFSTGNSNVNDH